MKLRILLVIGVSTVLISACSSSDSGGTDVSGSNTENSTSTPSGTPTANGGGNITFFGGINASYSTLDDETEWSAQFFSSAVPFPQADLANEFTSSVSDTCKLLDPLEGINPPENTDFDFENLNFVPTTVSAGEVLPITSPAGTYGSLVEQQVFGFLIYNTEDRTPIAGAIPNDLVVDIPGASNGFPALSAIAFPSASATEFSIQGNTVTWAGSNMDGASINITASAVANGSIATQAFIECDLIDDGSHQIEAGILPEGSVEFPLFLASRQVERVIVSGNALLTLRAEADVLPLMR